MTPEDLISRLNYFTSSSVSSTDGLALYNLVYKDIANRANWRELETSATLTATDDTAVALPSDFKTAVEVQVDGNVYVRVSYQDRERYPSNSMPGVYYIYGTNIYFPGYSNSSGSSNVSLSYLKQVAELTAITDTPLFPISFDPVFTDIALGYFWQKEGNYGKSSNHFSYAENKIADLIKINNKLVKGEVHRMKHPSEDYRRNW